MLRTPFYVVSDTENTLTWKSANGVKISWSLNEDLTEGTEMPADMTTEVPMQADKKVYLFCTEDQPSFIDNNLDKRCAMSCKSAFSVGGNACFLTESSCYKKTTFQPKCRNGYQFYRLFEGTSVVDASEMVFGFNSLTYGCCRYMFENCKSLVSAPVLPATTLGTICYYEMFAGCTSLVDAPELPTTTLAEDCYYRMFYGCEKVMDLHFPKSLENDSTFIEMYSAPNFGADNATVHYDL